MRFRNSIGVATAGVATATLLSWSTDPAAIASTCGAIRRAGTFGRNISIATGVTAVIRVPQASEFNLMARTVSGADVYMSNLTKSAYVQIGWYVGRASQLPYTSTPRMFWGENSPDLPNNETLHAGPAVTPGTYYSFMVTNPLNGSNRFNVWFQGSLVAQSTYAHNLGYPAFNGEVGDSCTPMDGWASHKNAPYDTLQYRNGAWHYFEGTTYPNPPSNYVGGRPHGHFTAFGLGPY